MNNFLKKALQQCYLVRSEDFSQKREKNHVYVYALEDF